MDAKRKNIRLATGTAEEEYMRRRVSLLLLVASMAVLMLAVAGPVQATDSYAYVVVKNSVCPDPSYRVVGIQGVESPTGWHPANGYDYGDNIIYPRVRLYQTNYFHGEVYCVKQLWWGGRIGTWASTWGSFKPTAPKQTFWIGRG